MARSARQSRRGGSNRPASVYDRWGSRTVVLSCRIHAFGGSDDPLVTESDLHEWRSRTSGEFSVHVLRGGHFYLSDGPQLVATLLPLLSRLPAVSEKC